MVYFVFLFFFQVPCSLEYWDELQQAFVLYQEFSLSECSACQLQLPSLSLTDQQKELVASDLWRIVLNSNGEGGDEQRWEKILYFILCCTAKLIYHKACLCLDTNMYVDLEYVWSPVWGSAERERVRESVCTQAAEHKELAMCPSPHIWCAGAGSGLGRRSDRPNEISQHTKCLSGPIRIPSCLPWVYLIEGKLTGSRRSKAPIGLAHKFLGLAWVGLGWIWMGWVGLGQPSSVTPQRACFYSLLLTTTVSSLHLSHVSLGILLHLLFFFPIFHFSLSSFSFLPHLNLLSFFFSLSPLFTSSWD